MLKRVMRACQSQQLSVEEYEECLKVIFRCQEHDLIPGWKHSRRDCIMELLNSDPAYPLVAQMEVELIRRGVYSD